MTNKPCKHCGSEKHMTFMCYQAPKKPIKAKRQMNRVGKITKQWISTRHEWIKQNPPNHQGRWECYLKISPYCLKVMDVSQMQLDHVISRSRRPDLRFDHSNLKPCCRACNELKASRDVEELRV